MSEDEEIPYPRLLEPHDTNTTQLSRHNVLAAENSTSNRNRKSSLLRDADLLQVQSRNGKRCAHPCLYCGLLVKTRTRHISKVHCKEPEVVATLYLPLKSRNAHFKQLKRDGINKYNLSIMGEDNPILQRERYFEKHSTEDLSICGKCTGVFSKRSFHMHRKICRTDSLTNPTKIPATVYMTPMIVDEDFKTKVLAKFIRDPVGLLCSSDPTIVSFGQRQYFKMKSKKDKQTEVKRSVMTEMRRLGTLFFSFKRNCEEMGYSG